MRFIQYVALLLFVGMVSVFAQLSNSVSVHYSGYTITVPSDLRNAADAELAPVIVGKLDVVPQKNPKSRFGILFRENASKPEGVTVLEIIDAATNKVIKRVSLAEYYGKETASWKNISAENKATETSMTSVFQSQVKEGEFKFVREISVQGDKNLPGGKKMMMVFSIEPKSSMKLKIKFSGIAEGVVSSSTQSFVITNADPLTTLCPAIEVFVKNVAQIQVEQLKKGKPQSFTVTSKDVSFNAGKNSEVLTFAIVGTSILFPGYAEKQAKSFEKYFITSKPVPEIVVITQPDKQKTYPGDTLTYTIYYHNIGTDVATDISLSGPIPNGARYIDGSAESNGSTMKLSRQEAQAPAQGAVTGLNWNDNRILKLGEERCVRYKVVIR
jgi:uncharacterized repeat protein (TIGR01451 family)